MAEFDNDGSQGSGPGRSTPTETAPEAAAPVPGQPRGGSGAPPPAPAPTQQGYAQQGYAQPGAPGAPPGRPGASVLWVDDLLRTTAKLFRRNLGASLATGFVFSLPTIALGIAALVWQREMWEEIMQLQGASPSPRHAIDLGFKLMLFGGVTTLVSTLFQAMGSGCFAFLAIESLAGRRPSFGPTLGAAFGKLHLLVLVAVLQTIAIALGMMLCLLPGIFLTVLLSLAPVVVMAEGANPFDALGRSARLTEGNRVSLFLAMLVLWVAWMTVVLVNNLITPQPEMDPVAGTLDMPSVGAQLFGTAVGMAFEIVRLAAFGLLAGVAYARVRGIRDGVNADELARVFA
ncbi:MAG: YciC family protein [Myxococcota bacterium]